MLSQRQTSLQQTSHCLPRQQVLIVSLLDRDDHAAFDRAFVERYGPVTRLDGPPPRRWLHLLRRIIRYRQPAWRILFFDAGGRPRDGE